VQTRELKGRTNELDPSARIGRVPSISRGFHGRRPAVDLLVALGHDPAAVRTERFGPMGR
jgi:hypothetical protein